MKENNQEMSSTIEELSADGGLIMYKIFGELCFSFGQASSTSSAHWSGFYTQISPEHSMSGGDGASEACLIALRVSASSHLKLIKIDHPILSNHSVPGDIKARLVRDHLTKKYGIQFLTEHAQLRERFLLEKLGEENILLQCVDCEDPEIIIPHSILNADNFAFEGLLQFQKSSDEMLRTIGWKQYSEEMSPQAWSKVTGQEQFEPYLLLKNNPEAKSLVSQII